MNNDPAIRMNKKQAKFLWNSLTPQQKAQFNDMLRKLQNGELELKKINVDDNENIKTIVLDEKRKSEPTVPYAKYFPKNYGD